MKCRELGRGTVTERAVWPMFIVVASPGADDGSCGVETFTPVVVQTLVPEASIEALDERSEKHKARREGRALCGMGA